MQTATAVLCMRVNRASALRQAELVADLEGDRTAVQVRPVDGFAAPLARRGLRHDAAA
jgi:hypothetical protein